MRAIFGFPHYFADDAGLIWSDRSGIPHAVPRYIAGGYFAVTLRREDGSLVAWLPVHKLVLLAFIGPRADDVPCFHGRYGIRCNAPHNLRVQRSPCSLPVSTIATVLDSLAAGLTIKETARRCSVGPRTVSRIRRRFAPRERCRVG
jgi:hypothetical protein